MPAENTKHVGGDDRLRLIGHHVWRGEIGEMMIGRRVNRDRIEQTLPQIYCSGNLNLYIPSTRVFHTVLSTVRMFGSLLQPRARSSIQLYSKGSISRLTYSVSYSCVVGCGATLMSRPIRELLLDCYYLWLSKVGDIIAPADTGTSQLPCDSNAHPQKNRTIEPRERVCIICVEFLDQATNPPYSGRMMRDHSILLGFCSAWVFSRVSPRLTDPVRTAASALSYGPKA